MDIFDLSQDRLSIGTLGKAIIILMILVSIVAAQFYLTHRSVGFQISYLKGSPIIILNCGDSQVCANQTILVVTNNQISYPLAVNVTYTCNCTVNVDLSYYPNIQYRNGTLFYPHVIQPNQNMTIVATAIRTSGFDNVLLHIDTQAY